MVARRSVMAMAYSGAMLGLRRGCELCDRALPPASTEAMICTFECTFCARCVRETLHNVCPNCGGGFSPRPVRPRDRLPKDPPPTKRVTKPLHPPRYPAPPAPHLDPPGEPRRGARTPDTATPP